MPFSDYRTALVTGANTGMGAAVTEMFTKRGLTVYGVARNADKLGEVADRTGMIPLPVDITDTAALAEAVGGLEIDILVNNAGGCPQPETFSTPKKHRSTRWWT